MAENCSKGLSCVCPPLDGELMLAPYVRLYQGAAPSEVANLGASAWKVSLLTDMPPYWKVRMLGYWPARTAASSAGLEKEKWRLERAGWACLQAPVSFSLIPPQAEDRGSGLVGGPIEGPVEGPI